MTDLMSSILKGAGLSLARPLNLFILSIPTYSMIFSIYGAGLMCIPKVWHLAHNVMPLSITHLRLPWRPFVKIWWAFKLMLEPQYTHRPSRALIMSAHNLSAMVISRFLLSFLVFSFLTIYHNPSTLDMIRYSGVHIPNHSLLFSLYALPLYSHSVKDSGL